MQLFDLAGKVAIVTGGNGGVGLGMATGLASCGATIVIAARDAKKASAALATLRDFGARALFKSVDITKKVACDTLVSETEAEFGRLDILVNNAGIMLRKPPQDITDAEWHQVMEANLTSMFSCCQAAYPAMKRVGGGKIINLGSMASTFGSPLLAAYAASKGGVVQLDPRPGHSLGSGQHSGQRGAAWVHRHRDHPSRTGRDTRPTGAHRTPHARPPLGSARRLGRHSSLSGGVGI